MVKVRYTYNNKIVDKDVYEQSLTLCDMKNSKCVNPFEEPTCRFNNQLLSSTSTSLVNEQPPIVNKQYLIVNEGTIVNEQPSLVNEHAPTVNEALPINKHALIVNEGPINEHAPTVNEDLPINKHALIVNEALPINEHAPTVHEALPNNNNENVAAVVADRDHNRLQPMAVIQNIIGECSPPFVKQLTKTDVTDSQGRLALHKEFVKRSLIPMFNDDEDLNNGINVIVYDTKGREYDMTFKLWASKLYVLTKSWKEFYKTNDLTQPGESISVWMFRHVVDDKLCFAIMKGEAEED